MATTWLTSAGWLVPWLGWANISLKGSPSSTTRSPMVFEEPLWSQGCTGSPSLHPLGSFLTILEPRPILAPNGNKKNFCSKKQKQNWFNLRKSMATHSSTLAWKIPWMEEPVGLPSLGSHRVGHDWSDLAAAPAEKINQYNRLKKAFNKIQPPFVIKRTK